MENNKEESLSKSEIIVPIIFIVTVLGLWGLCWYFLRLDIKNRGSFGDMFGAVNALFSGLAFAGIIFAIILQRKELSLQRKELELSRNVMKEQVKYVHMSSQIGALDALLEIYVKQKKRFVDRDFSNIELEKLGFSHGSVGEGKRRELIDEVQQKINGLSKLLEVLTVKLTSDYPNEEKLPT